MRANGSGQGIRTRDPDEGDRDGKTGAGGLEGAGAGGWYPEGGFTPAPALFVEPCRHPGAGDSRRRVLPAVRGVPHRTRQSNRSPPWRAGDGDRSVTKSAYCIDFPSEVGAGPV